MSELTFALKDNQRVSINDVETGLQCNCFCPKCGDKLIAKNKGEKDSRKREFHFAHYKNQECNWNDESEIHELAKEVFRDNKKILLPSYEHENKTLIDSKEVIFDSVTIEKIISSEDIVIKPDAIGIIHDKELYVEFAFTHKVNKEKIEKIKKLNKPCVEINICNIDYDYEKMLKHLLENTSSKKWIHNPKGEELIKKSKQSHTERNISESKNTDIDSIIIPNTKKYDKYEKTRVIVNKNQHIEDIIKNENNRINDDIYLLLKGIYSKNSEIIKLKKRINVNSILTITCVPIVSNISYSIQYNNLKKDVDLINTQKDNFTDNDLNEFKTLIIGVTEIQKKYLPK